MLYAQARHQQPGFATCAETVEIVDGGPELVVADGKVLDQFGAVLQDAQDDLLQARVALVMGEAGGVFEEAADFGRVGNSYSHGAPHRSLLLSVTDR